MTYDTVKSHQKPRLQTLSKKRNFGKTKRVHWVWGGGQIDPSLFRF